MTRLIKRILLFLRLYLYVSAKSYEVMSYGLLEALFKYEGKKALYYSLHKKY